MSLSPDKVKSLLGDLGKPTLRGVRRCPKCNTLNGTRGISCKNKACDMVFKEKDKKKGHSAEAVKIITGSTVQVYSVRLRDRGPDYRGFVQLPLVQDLEGNPAENVEPAVLAQAARCYVEACTRNNNIAVNHPNTACPHINAAIHCVSEAQPLTLKNSVLNSLQVPSDIKTAIWLLATETSGPLVQRVTKNIMVVKCKASAKQLLGFLHFSFFETKGRGNGSEYRFHCSCKEFKESLRHTLKKEESHQKRCVHFFACICAFASDEALAEEFAYFINLDNCLTLDEFVDQIPDIGEQVSPESIVDQVFTVVTAEECSEAFQAASVGQPSTADGVEIVQVIEEAGVEQDQFVECLTAPPPLKKAKLRENNDTLAQASSALLTLQECTGGTGGLSGGGGGGRVMEQVTPSKKPPTHKPLHQKPTPVKKLPGAPVDELSSTVSFRSWLGSITERVNQTMHYQFDGNPEPLVFHSPQTFFDCLQQRIASGHKKKRLPNSTTAFVRRDALPLGTFTKYTWHITNILHVKHIFDTPDMPLEITRSFVENRDGTFDPYEPKVRQSSQYGNTKPIRPFELKTYLKVGNTSPEQKEPTPFIIEWIPDILPTSHIGELRIKFEYGHQRNGHVEKRPAPRSSLPIAPQPPQPPPLSRGVINAQGVKVKKMPVPIASSIASSNASSMSASVSGPVVSSSGLSVSIQGLQIPMSSMASISSPTVMISAPSQQQYQHHQLQGDSVEEVVDDMGQSVLEVAPFPT